MNWHGDETLQINDEADVVGLFRVRVPGARVQDGKRVWNYYGVPPAVAVVLVSVFNEQKAAHGPEVH